VVQTQETQAYDNHPQQRRRQWNLQACTLDRGMEKGGDRPKPILPVAHLEAVPTGRVSYSSSRWTLNSRRCRSKDTRHRRGFVDDGPLPVLGHLAHLEAQVVDDSFHAQPPFLKHPRGILQRLNTSFLVLGEVRERWLPARVLLEQATIPLRRMIGEAPRNLVEDDLRVGVHQHLLTSKTSEVRVMSRRLQICRPKQNSSRIVVSDYYNRSSSERNSRSR
jgi:hypothetical protein